MEYLNNNRIIYRRNPVTDKPSDVFEWGNFYKEGTHQCYELFRSKAKINTFRSLKWHLLVLLYLNPELEEDQFKKLSKYITCKSNNFITFEISEDVLFNIIESIYKLDLERPPKNKLRKIIFKDQTGLTKSEKLSIVGKLIGRSKIATKENIYECMNAIHDMHECITVQAIARMLGCSTRTVYRNLDNQLKTEKNLLNSMI
jgi:hypothetical protein|tara:strand:+ start:147 stop:749 length:603 start_codon:yes stop_codon:yes gene_type:complete